MNGFMTLKRIFTKRKFLKFRTPEIRLRMVSKHRYMKKIMFLCINTV